MPYQFAAKWTLSSVPMFLLMGYVCYHGGMTKALFAAARAWLGALPGGLAIASVFGAAWLCGGDRIVGGLCGGDGADRGARDDARGV